MSVLKRITALLLLICITPHSFAGTESSTTNSDGDLVFPAFYIDNNVGGFQNYLADHIVIDENKPDSVEVSFSVDTFGFPEHIEVKGDSMLCVSVYKALSKARFAPAIKYEGYSSSFLVDYDASFRIVFNAAYDSLNDEEVRDAKDYRLIKKKTGDKKSVQLTCKVSGDSVSTIKNGEIWVAVDGDYSGNQKVMVKDGFFEMNIITEDWEVPVYDIALQFDNYKTCVVKNIPVNNQVLEVPLTYNGRKQEMNYFGDLKFLTRLPVKTKL